MKVVLMGVVSMMLLGCASSKVDDFNSSLRSGAKVYSLNNVSSLSAKPLTSTPVKESLSEDDPLISVNGNKTAFDIFSFRGAPGAHMLTMRTYCDCLGFNKDLLLPEVKIIDSKGNLLEVSLMNKQRVQPLLGAFYFEFTWVFDTNSDAPVKIIIGSNNQSLGDVATTVSGTGAVGVPSANNTYYGSFTIDGLKVRSAPFGKYEVFAE